MTASPVFSFDQRPVINLSVLCSPIGPNPKDLCFTLPGGVQICPSSGHLNIGAFEAAKMALDAVSSALAPLAPTFRILDAVLSLAKIVALIPEVVGPPPRFDKLLAELEKLAESLRWLARMIPALSIPIMLLQLLDMLIATLDGASSEFASIAVMLTRIQQAQINVSQAPGLIPVLTCANASYAQQMDNLEHLLAGINPAIDMFNFFVGLVPGLSSKIKPLPALDMPLGAGPAEAAKYIHDVAIVLHAIRAQIPI